MTKGISFFDGRKRREEWFITDYECPDSPIYVTYIDLSQRIEEVFAEIEDEAIADFKKTDETYAVLYQQISKLKADNPFIGKVMDASGGISLTAEEHEDIPTVFRI